MSKSLDPDQARQFVIDDVAVSHRQVMLMKSLLLNHYNDNPDAMLETAVRVLGAQKPHLVVLHATVDPRPALRQFHRMDFMHFKPFGMAAGVDWKSYGLRSFGRMQSGKFGTSLSTGVSRPFVPSTNCRLRCSSRQ